MNVLVACEFSGAVRRAFRNRGHAAWSCDLLPAEDGSPHHLRGDAIEAIRSRSWDLVIAHPPCTHLAVSGNRWYAGTELRELALVFVSRMMDAMDASSGRWALENPVSVISSRIRKPDQTIQPWQFGHGETKRTCLWLRGLPPLQPTNLVPGREARVHRMPPSARRSAERSRTYSGVAKAMAVQWG